MYVKGRTGWLEYKEEPNSNTVVPVETVDNYSRNNIFLSDRKDGNLIFTSSPPYFAGYCAGYLMIKIQRILHAQSTKCAIAFV